MQYGSSPLYQHSALPLCRLLAARPVCSVIGKSYRQCCAVSTWSCVVTCRHGANNANFFTLQTDCCHSVPTSEVNLTLSYERCAVRKKRMGQMQTAVYPLLLLLWDHHPVSQSPLILGLSSFADGCRTFLRCVESSDEFGPSLLHFVLLEKNLAVLCGRPLWFPSAASLTCQIALKYLRTKILYFGNFSHIPCTFYYQIHWNVLQKTSTPLTYSH